MAVTRNECPELAQATISLKKKIESAFAEIASVFHQLGIKHDSFEMFGATNHEAVEKLRKRALSAL